MMTNHYPLDRRTFLVAGGLGFFGLNLANAAAYAAGDRTPTRRRTAKSTIMIWLSGGASHIDTWDMKPDAVAEYRGPFRPMPTSAPGITLCEHLPHLARQAHHLAIVRSLGDHGRGTGDHHAGYYYNLTGHAPDRTFHQLLNARTPYPTDWPSMASVVAMKRPPHPFLPNAITLPHKEGAPEYTRPGQFSARLGIGYDPVFVDGTREPAASRSNDHAVDAVVHYALAANLPRSVLVKRESMITSMGSPPFVLPIRRPTGRTSKTKGKATGDTDHAPIHLWQLQPIAAIGLEQRPDADGARKPPFRE